MEVCTVLRVPAGLRFCPTPTARANPNHNMAMNLIVATRVEPLHLRIDVDGKWRYGDALNLAYLIKAAAARTGRAQMLLDLRRVSTPADSEGRFLICDRLRRALSGPARVALVSDSALVDQESASGGSGQDLEVACFDSEGAALQWLRA